MRTLVALIRLLRPLNLLITVVGVLLGAALSSAPAFIVDLGAVVLAAASALAIAAGGNALNDVYDADIDFVNRPSRPIPSGLVSSETARIIWITATLFGVGAAAFVSSIHLTLAFLATVLLFTYSRYLKRMPFVGNLAIAAVVALAIVYGGWAVGSPVPSLVGAAFAALTTFAREIVKDIEDLEGDARAGARTAPVAFGVGVPRVAASATLILTVVLTPLPFLLMDYSPLFLFLMLTADAFLLRALWLMPSTPDEAAPASAWLKGAMLAGIAALFAAGAIR
ncbi:MAG: geranylgeranylglycerol-phosphate geranylgeranyltransferase [Rhodothermales bacterium]